jgi:hypothetical protein
MKIVIAMAGLSQRFINEGFVIPKYMLYAKNNSLFNLAISSFREYFNSVDFIFIARDVFSTKTFIEQECKLLGIKSFSVVILEGSTRGQADSVYKGLNLLNMNVDDSLLIFNIDTFRLNFILPKDIGNWDGYLEVFEGSGPNWSYAKTENPNSTRVIETAEKNEISTHCSTGLYYFKSFSQFKSAFENEMMNPNIRELYVAPLYNYLISKGLDIHINIIKNEDVIFCGIPMEYYDYLTRIFK